ncbi:threonine/homoserine/homoserine lactone efflux protein [Agrobacterium larrymoorei]|uniref:Threonine/homoserine/homoserine lactone efflux protein n=1 Tax=Agrobacterium larrymoorei TaxID=160699 RepID=A0AAJ2BM71_9HYPH|nr:threonine/homoserine/homoserine lactone efflux protein [Agrobacterium larrymoorei]
MPIENWLAFVAASAIMLAIPGPTILLVISYALGHGRKASSATVAGVALGDFTAMTASMLGLGALLATSAALFTVLKWVGAAYLIYLGIKLWRAPVGTSAQGEGEVTGRERPLKTFLHTYIVTALNPKSIIFLRRLPAAVPGADPAVLAAGAYFRSYFSCACDLQRRSLWVAGKCSPQHHPQALRPARRQPHRWRTFDRCRTARGRLEEGGRLKASPFRAAPSFGI